MEKEKRRAAVFIDGQFMLPFSFKKMNEYLKEYDTLIKRVYVTDKQISEGKSIVAALYNSGFEPIITGFLKNIDAYFIVDVMEVITRDDIDTLIIGSGDGDMAHLLHKAKFYNKKVVLAHKGERSKHRVSSALKAVADEEWNLYEEEAYEQFPEELILNF